MAKRCLNLRQAGAALDGVRTVSVTAFKASGNIWLVFSTFLMPRGVGDRA
jgi:hypothetical protein